MKHLIKAFIYAILIAVILPSCAEKKTKFKIGILQPSKTKARFINDGKYIVSSLNVLGVETIVAFANNDDAIQIKQGREMIENGVDMLIIIPVNGNTIAPLVRECKNNGVRVMAYNRLIRNVDYDIFFTGDNHEMALNLASIPLKEKPNGQYIILAGDRFDQNGYELKHELDSIFKPLVESGQIKIIYKSYIEGWKAANAIFELKEALNSVNPENVSAIISCNGSMAQASIEILKEYKLNKKVIVVGQDADIKALKEINEGNQHLTIYHPHIILGKKTAEVCLQLLKEKSTKNITKLTTANGKSNIPTVRVKSIPITKENMNQLFEKGYFKREDVFN